MNRTTTLRLALILCAAAASSVRGQFTWSPTATTSSFETGANWGGTAPSANSTLTFGASTQSGIVLGADYTATSLTFSGTYPAYTFSTGNSKTLSIDSGGITVGGSGAGVTFGSSLSLSLAANQTWNTAGNLSVSGMISGAGTLTKTGTGTLTLSGANIFTGGVTVSAGTLFLSGSSVITYPSMPYQIDSSPVGIGVVTLAAGATLAPKSGAGKVLLFNRVVLTGDASVGVAGSTDELRFETKLDLDGSLRGSSAGRIVTIKGGVVTLAADPTSGSHGTYNIDTYAVDSGAALIFAFQNALPVTAVTAAAGSYVGVANGALETAPATYNYSVGFSSVANLLIAKLSSSGFAGTFGFDSEDTMSPATYTGTLDFSAFSNASFDGLSTLGSAIIGTGATLFAVNSGANSGKLAFSALNGGTLQVDTALLTAHNFTNGLLIGREDGRGDQGIVALTSPSNNYTGGTTLKSGTLSVRDANALGTGTLTATNATTVPTSSANAPKLTTTLSGRSALGLTLTNNLVVNTSYASSAYGLGIGGIDDFTLSGAITGTGVIDKYGAGKLTLTGDATGFTGKFTVASGGTLSIGNGGTTGAISANVANSGTLLFDRSNAVTYGGVVSGSGNLSKSGAGTLTLTGANTYTGSTLVNAGALLITGTNTGGGTITVGSGAIFGGTGSTNGSLVLNSGGGVSPGASPGTLSVGATTFAGGANFNFEINNTLGAAGTQWDLLSISGALTITANSGNPFTVNLTSLNLSNTAGLLTNFNNTSSYSWLFVTTTGGVTGFAANAFQFNTANFQNSLGTGSFYVSNLGNDLYLNFTPVPEPSTYALLAVGLGVIVILARRRRS